MTHPVDIDRSLNKPMDLLRLMRPLQWIKNAFVLTGFVFGGDYHDFYLLFRVLCTVVAFSLISSAVYIFNDLLDYEKDRSHPTKKNRPIPSGKVSSTSATILLSFLAISGFSLGLWVSMQVGVILLIYVIMNIVYSYKLKEIVILDVFCISFGFMLRILSGTVGVGIPPSKWLLLCGMLLTLFLGFAKRRAELDINTINGKGTRKVLHSYSLAFLDELITICATGAIITYSLYTMSDQATQIHGTQRLIITVPIVAYAIFRYLFLLNRHNLGEDPSSHLVKDPHIVVAVLCWTLATFCIRVFH